MTTTKTYRLRKVCERKQVFGRKTAEKVAAEMNRRADGQPVNAYKCPLCKNWHVGRVDKRAAR